MTLLVPGNPLVCSCSSYNQKIWLRQHRKWLDAERRGSKIGPQCHEPTPISDRYLLTVKDSELCPLPSVNRLQVSNLNPNSFLVTWDSPDTTLTGLKGFIVAGADKEWVWADAVIEGNTIVVSSPDVPLPKYVRYGWAWNPVVNLFNAEGLPAITFRTDE